MKINYTIALLMSNEKNNFQNLSKSINISPSSIQRELESHPIEIKDIISFVPHIFGDASLKLLIDDTLVKKEYAKCIEETKIHFDSSKKIYVNSYCLVAAMLSNGDFAVPITFKLWLTKDRKKYELAQDLILQIMQYVKLEIVLMDGLFANKNMIEWLNCHNLNFEMRFHSNRIISDKKNKAQVKNFKNLKPKGRRHSRTIKIKWHKFDLYLTSVKHVNKDGCIKFSYQIANYKAISAVHVHAYRIRWHIEKFFRTAKQYLGLQDCISVKLSKQLAHFQNIFFAYTILQYFMKQKTKFSCPEDVISFFKSKKHRLLAYLKSLVDQIFSVVYA